ncbi:MAG TPA: hypothetical protein VKA83_25865 [Methylomirabilota bacterium]|nr:hypothetical protein [Methylomirabilota bacterium]
MTEKKNGHQPKLWSARVTYENTRHELPPWTGSVEAERIHTAVTRAIYEARKKLKKGIHVEAVHVHVRRYRPEETK